MIVSIRGTNGAGKSTLVRTIMDSLIQTGCTITTIKYPADKNKRRPMGYICESGAAPIFVVGHYETKNGGLDTSPSLAYAYELAVSHLALGFNVIMEGKNFTESPAWILEQHNLGVDIRVVLIDIPVKQCIKAVRARGHKIKKETIIALHAKSREQYKIFVKAGVRAFKGTRQQCLKEVQSWLKK